MQDRIEILFISVICVVITGTLGNVNFENDVGNNKKFKSVPTTVKTYENDTVLLPCYHNLPYRYIRWYQEDNLLVDSRHPEIPPPERVHLWANGSLQVSHVKSEDTGEYYCEITTTSGHAVQIHAIEVQYPPVVVSSPSGVVELPVGSVFEIVCDVKGMPHPVISWRRSDSTLANVNSEKLENKKRMLVEVRSREMSGPIECIALNGVGQPAVAGIHLIVLFKPEVDAVAHTVHTKIGMRAHLECHVFAAPAGTVQWFHHGVPVVPNASSRIARNDVELQSNRSLIHYYTESTHMLIIKQVKDHDLGMYECRAENKIGFKGVVIELTGRPMPCVFKVSPIVSTSTSHNLIWQTESLSPITDYKLKFRQVPSGNVTPQNRPINVDWNELTIPAEFSEGPIHTIGYTLHGLQPASVYEVGVLSRNRYGWSDNSKIVRFATGGEIEVPNYSTESEIEYDDDRIQENFLADVTPASINDYHVDKNTDGSRNSGAIETVKIFTTNFCKFSLMLTIFVGIFL